MSRTLDVDVVVVGAGPTGLMLASCLTKLGVSSVLLDGKSEPTRESRALVHQARTMEIYDQLGVVDRVLDQAEVASEIVPGFEARRFPIHQSATARDGRDAVSASVRPRTEQDRARSRRSTREPRREGVLVSPGAPAERTADGGVECTTGGGDIHMVHARYCVGADGSSSLVRELIGIPFEGKTNEHTFYVTDATRVKGLAEKSINLRFGVRDFLLAFPMGDEADQRLLGVVRGSADAVTEATTRRTLQRVFAVTYAASRWFSTYRVHHRVAARFRKGPVFLAGDAAHVHSPVGAQGMNTGLQDAHNLACKISDVLAGRAS